MYVVRGGGALPLNTGEASAVAFLERGVRGAPELGVCPLGVCHMSAQSGRFTDIIHS